jgi:hypothetical protein
MSYLRGPLTRTQVRELMRDRQPDQPATTPLAGTGISPSQPAPIAATPAATAQPELADKPVVPFATTPPALPPGIQQVYLPGRKGVAAAALVIETREGGSVEVQDRHLLYVPAVLGMGRVHFVDRRREVDEREDFVLLTQVPAGGGVVRWDRAQPLDLTLRELMDRPEPEAYFDQLPEAINESTELTALKKDLVDHLYRTSRVTLLYSPVLKTYSRPNESERDFRMRLQQLAREQRDEEVDTLSRSYEKQLRKLEEQLRRAETARAKKESEAAARKREIFVSIGESVLGVLLGRRSTRVASSAMRKYHQSSSAGMAAEEAEEQVETLEREILELKEELQEQVDAITARWDEALATFEEFAVTPRRQDVEVDVFALAWTPHWRLTYQDRGGMTRMEVVPAY